MQQPTTGRRGAMPFFLAESTLELAWFSRFRSENHAASRRFIENHAATRRLHEIHDGSVKSHATSTADLAEKNRTKIVGPGEKRGTAPTLPRSSPCPKIFVLLLPV